MESDAGWAQASGCPGRNKWIESNTVKRCQGNKNQEALGMAAMARPLQLHPCWPTGQCWAHLENRANPEHNRPSGAGKWDRPPGWAGREQGPPPQTAEGCHVGESRATWHVYFCLNTWKKWLLSERSKVAWSLPSLKIFRLRLGTAWWG